MDGSVKPAPQRLPPKKPYSLAVILMSFRRIWIVMTRLAGTAMPHPTGNTSGLSPSDPRGYCDALRARHPHEVIYTYWDYQAGAGNVTMGCGLTICYYPPKLLTASAKLVLTRPRAGRNRQITPHLVRFTFLNRGDLVKKIGR